MLTRNFTLRSYNTQIAIVQESLIRTSKNASPQEGNTYL